MPILIQNATVIAIDDEHGTAPFAADIRVEADGDATQSAAVIRELLETTPAPRP